MPYVFLTSNASMSFPEAVEECMKARARFAEVVGQCSGRRAVREDHGRLGHGSFSRALDNIKAAWAVRAAKGYKTGLYASSIQYDGAQQDEDGVPAHRTRAPVRRPALLAAALLDGRFCDSTGSGARLSSDRGQPGSLDALREPLPCWSAFTEGHVTADGKLSACCFDANAHWTMGDLNEVIVHGSLELGGFRDAARSASEARCERHGVREVHRLFLAPSSCCSTAS